MENQKKVIFIVDDSIVNLTVGESALSDFYDVFTLNSGERLFKILQKITPDLILLDIEMPVLDGHEILRRLKANPETTDIPVIFLTGLSDEQTENIGLSLGAADYISKPFSPPLLLKRIENQILIQSQKRKLEYYESKFSNQKPNS